MSIFSRQAQAYAKAGGLVTICVHYPSPIPPYGLRDAGVDLRELLKPGPAREVWLKQADYVADALADLQSSDVVVLFRPLHELTSNGHWWTQGKATGTPDFDATYKELWIDLFKYYTEIKKLNNLLWVWNPKGNHLGAYPGGTYVDIVGPDQYDGDWGDSYEQNFAEDLAGMIATGKVFGVQETGPSDATSYDAMKLIRMIREKAPTTAYFLVWHDPKYRLSNMQNLPQLVDDPWIVTRDELPDFRAAR